LVLGEIFEIKNLRFEKLKSKLKLHFEERHLAQTYYTQFMHRRQKFTEDLASLEYRMTIASSISQMLKRRWLY